MSVYACSTTHIHPSIHLLGTFAICSVVNDALDSSKKMYNCFHRLKNQIPLNMAIKCLTNALVVIQCMGTARIYEDKVKIKSLYYYKEYQNILTAVHDQD